MWKLVVGLMLIILLASCGARTNSCPPFPLPPPAVQAKFDALAAEDRAVWEWGNKLLILCRQLNTCKEQE